MKILKVGIYGTTFLFFFIFQVEEEKLFGYTAHKYFRTKLIVKNAKEL